MGKHGDREHKEKKKPKKPKKDKKKKDVITPPSPLRQEQG